ncbi:MAG: SDR family oxidoreductase [Burkholderiaceae bacterium]
MPQARTAFVTGAAQGTGMAIARKLGQEGSRILCIDRNATALGAAASQLRNEGIDAMELRARQITVNSVAPGFTDTPMTRSAPAGMFTAWEALEPRGKAAQPEEIAATVGFLASPQAAFITGQTVFVDGGKSFGGLGI